MLRERVQALRLRHDAPFPSQMQARRRVVLVEDRRLSPGEERHQACPNNSKS